MEGYVLVATGRTNYFSMAAAAARSIKFFDNSRGICLACDDEDHVRNDDRCLFDQVVKLPHVERLRGTEHHLYLNEISPFARTIYIDADCLLASAKIHDIWKQLENYHVTFPGRRITEGTWRMDIADLRRKFDIEYVVQLNGGVFYFDRSEQSDTFFATAQNLFENRQRVITCRHNTGGGLANEPVWGVTMALTQSKIFPLSEHLNVSTLRTERWAIDSTPSIRLWKDKAIWTPIICHFLGLGGPKCPNDLYRAFVALTGSVAPGA